MPQTTLTRELLRKLLAGDLESERVLFERHRALLVEKARVHPLLKRLRSTVSPEDVVQEVFWRSLSAELFTQFEDRGRGSLEALLTTILRRTLIDMTRRADSQKRGGALAARPLESLDDAELAHAGGRSGSASTPSSDLHADELLRSCRERLGDDEWAVWHAIELAGRDAGSLSREQGISPAAVRARLFRARQKLIEAFTDESGTSDP